MITRNLPEGRNENLKLKVAALFTEGLKLARIGTFNVERKINKSGRDGVVVVSCKSRDDRESILSAKNKLKVSRQYSNIYIHPDMTLQQRIESENMRVLAKTLKSVNPDLRVRGSRLVDESARSDSQSNARSNRRREHNSHTGSYDRHSSTSRHRDSSDYRTQRSSYNESFDRRSSRHHSEHYMQDYSNQ